MAVTFLKVLLLAAALALSPAAAQSINDTGPI